MLMYRIYWNNICILSRYEENYLKDKLDAIKHKYNIDFQIEYFGLGKEKKLSEKLKEDIENGNMADVIISTDLEIFENNEIYEKYKDKLQDLDNVFSLKDNIRNSNINRNKKLVPFLNIPLLIVGNKKMIKNNIPESIEEVINESFIFGGINNSAGTSVVKGIWYKYGERGLKNLLENGIIKEMPIQAFHAVKNGQCVLGLVPSVFAKIGDCSEDLKIIWPKDGALSIPSYIAINKSVDLKTIEILKMEIFNEEFSNFFVNRGDIISCFKDTLDKDYFLKNNFNLTYPDDMWFKNLDNKRFEDIYKNISRY